MTTWVLQVACDVPVTVSATGVFDYAPIECETQDCVLSLSQPSLWIGRAVLVPFGKQSVVGIVVGVAESTDVPEGKLKQIRAVLPFVPPLDDNGLELIRFMSRYYQRGLGEVALPALPMVVRNGKTLTVEEASPVARLSKGMRTWQKWQKMPRTPAPVVMGRELTLTAAQELVLSSLLNQLEDDSRDLRPQLLFGVTGSGKTEIYLQYLAQILQIDPQAQVLILVPEINLTPQLAARLNARFGAEAVVTLHSGLTESTRLMNWWRASNGQARVVLGTRLSVLTTLPHLRAIVVDEEHDSSYRQQEGVRYSARDVAIYRAHQLNIPIVLGSATPSLETWHNAQTGRYGLHRLSERAVTGASLPEVILVDVQKTAAQDGLSEPLRRLMSESMAQHNTTLLFQNRRGYAPVLYCGHCGHMHDCSNCAAHLVYHHTTRHLHCHHCGVQARVPKVCVKCGNADMRPIGQGTQRIEETVARIWPNAIVRRIDADSTRNKGELEHALADIAAGVADVVIGTQMLAKGHDWPNLNTVGVLDVDSGLFAQDYRAPERLFALLQQVIGRAGRGQTAGRVLIQTAFPEHPMWTQLRSHDFETFANDELAVRQQLGLPPFAAHALLHVAAPELKNAMLFAQKARELALALIDTQIAFTQVTVNAAVPMNMMRLNRQERAQVLIECPSRPRLQQFLTQWQAALVEQKSRLMWLIDVDPAEI
ncbi:replication restart helicase PriA [Hydromonas duriensis]|uniref:Replication restart protein PriA n=1 Tax=Hydromonas duriensis TaxID=1527608 RepID=A0A4R6Y746_9BURK|nr:primosomal protein N' [Hydromonas duriensis]TDR30920.1 replication restart DNA helicase PriA [Hydromonas duriensis]